MAKTKPGRRRFGRHLVLFLREPRLGRVKRRLARELGDVAALRFYRDTARRSLRRLSRDRRFTLWLALAPDRATRAAAPLGHGLRVARGRVLAQGGGDLGQRMARVFARLPPGEKAIVGGDIPALSPAHVARAFRLLAGSDAVFGPACDGGFWLVGFRRAELAPRAFRKVRWSSPHALADALANLEGRARVALADTLADVDDLEGYRGRGGAG